ncbi:hypothetical protein GPECTOR_27g651 [Gonium pectorale]|uniref:EF-hand domain-containing protein n=1 Tax=Gonium pectorale TaxID=33097 RepID=A0A150GF46_GONPE|nr:hypothetical protein GPECTOR_27g651 [Gonium pectorale]|eukprot:KXZ48481.1 hypothetical protein GPECTOR_27g651 [Gonium pectorale]
MIAVGAQNRDQKLMKILEELDRDGSGQIDVAELIEMLESVQRSRKERRYMCYGMIAMFVFGVVLIGTIIGLTYAMLYSLKDTEVKGGVMFVKNSDGATAEVVRTGSAEFSVMDGAMVQRVITPDSATNNAMGNVLRTADYMGKPQSLNSEIDIKELLELKYLLINGSGNAQLGLVVHGVARVPQEGSLHGTVLHIVTAAGTITLDGTIIAFSTAIANIFAEAGFRVSSTRRALLGSYAVLGFFNTIKDVAAAGKPPSEPEPKLPSENFIMKLKIYEPCVIPDQPDDDRCIYIPPQKPASQVFPNNQGNNHRRHNRHETTISYGDKIRVMYDFGIYPLWQKIEVMSGKTVYSWQENVLPGGNSTNEVAQYYCGNYSAASTGVAGFDPKSVLNYTYIGVDSVGEQIARHFELNVLQVSDKSGKTEVMRINYWDAVSTFAPLRFEFTHKDIGSVTIDVVEFRSIDASSPEANPEMFDVPALRPNFTCPNYPSIPRLSTPFMARGAVVPVDVPTGADPDTSRRMIAQSFALAQQWDKLDHVNGTGDWPQWALDMYGGVHPAKRAETAARRMLGECGSKLTYGLDVEPCGFDYWAYSRGAFGLSVRCGGNSDVVIKGCLSIGVGLPDDNWLVKKLGVDLSIDIASVCVGYNAKEKYFFIESTLTLNLIVFKAELSIQINFSSCCVWIASVTLEASIGVSFLNIWVTIGDIGFWGDWQKASYPCSKFSYNKARGSMEVLALPINSYQLRVEPEQGASDDTALNGISVGCMSGTANTVEGNNGYGG